MEDWEFRHLSRVSIYKYCWHCAVGGGNPKPASFLPGFGSFFFFFAIILVPMQWFLKVQVRKYQIVFDADALFNTSPQRCFVQHFSIITPHYLSTLVTFWNNCLIFSVCFFVSCKGKGNWFGGGFILAMNMLNKSIFFCKNRDVKMGIEFGMAVKSWNVIYLMKKCLEIN